MASRLHTLHTLVTAAALTCGLTSPQSSKAAEPVQTVTITGSSASNSASVAGFGAVPLSRSPFSASVISTEQMRDAGISGLADITRLDAGITDAYNAPGYWGQVAVRGFTLSNRSNFRRDGLPVNAETVLPTANKASLELLKGASGIQAGTSAPGGLLNLIVKRPTARALAQGSIEWTEPGTLALAADLSRRAGADDAWGLRLNAQATTLDPSTRNSRGRSHLLAAAAEWRLPADALLEVEAESSRQSQPSTPGFSLLGKTLPDPDQVDPRLAARGVSGPDGVAALHTAPGGSHATDGAPDAAAPAHR
jgi:iron complex outermembrane receptor protein